MRISDARPLTLFDDVYNESDVLTMAACRNWCGDFFEELTAVVSGGLRLKMDSRCVCPDLRLTPRDYIECKSIGRSGSIIAYSSRLEKDLNLVAEGNTLTYYLWHHSARLYDGLTLGEVRDSLSVSVRSVTIVSVQTLSTMLYAHPEKTLNKAHGGPGKRYAGTSMRRGYGAHGYTDGYSACLSSVRDKMPKVPNQYGRIVCYGREINGEFDVYREEIGQ